ncbi:basic proline-rich protein [Colletotrichum truncatum]|uniref:Basic proline-rich protein n=1 Tax=Colletotrichum truncatum TaxID=5467 RepID=A0ACC3Z5N6_COLTU|nr:basic proline-rich protein [Colletotrichum truncatum]KAF6795288.1 basic proline-rich protein [Colletotrichum truncatum]
MEPVPETERMEEFRSSPLSSLRVQNSILIPSATTDLDPLRKPPTLRRQTDPSPTSPTAPAWTLPPLPYRPRTTSPLSGHHVRSRSVASLAPPMSRTQSMPGVNGAGHILFSPQFRPASPSSSPSRIRIPRKPVDEAFPTSPIRSSVLEPDRRASESNISPNLGFATPSAILPRHRRPSSPLRHPGHNSTGSLPALPSTPTSMASSPSYRGYEPFSHSYSVSASFPSSSVPSTPTSTRSRSPSISSLETIPDSPDAEEAAMEAERIAQLKAAADAAERGDAAEIKGRSGLDVPSRGRTLGFGSRDKRKRWSVCGAERRQDLDLETIWED